MDDLPNLPPWGWPGSSRRLLSISAVLLALGLWWNAPATAPPTVNSVGEQADRGEFKVLSINPNTVPPPVLLALPRLGPTLVGRIVEVREERPFESPFDLQTRVKGIGPATLASLEPFLWFESADEPGSRFHGEQTFAVTDHP